MDLKKPMSVIIATALCFTMVGVSLAGCSKKAETTAMDKPVSQVVDSDDKDVELVTEKEKSNIIVLKDKDGNNLSIIPIMDVTGKTVISGYVKSATDKAGKALTDKNIVGKVVAVTTDKLGNHTITLKDNKTLYLKFTTNERKEIVAVQVAPELKYYEVTTKKSSDGNIVMQLTADKNGKPIEVIVKKTKSGKVEVVEKSTGKVVTDKGTDGGKVDTTTSSNNKTTSTTTTKKEDADATSKDKVVTVTDYSSLADINITLTKNSTAKVGLAPDSKIKVSLTKKAYVKSGVLYLIGNGDYYINQDSSLSTWYGKIVVKLGDKGLARVRLAGVNVSSKESTAIEFLDEDTVFNDVDADSEVGIKYNNTSTSKTNPNAILSFVDSTETTLSATGNSAKGSGTLYSECKLSIKGHGKANIKATNKNGIHVCRSLGIQNCTLNINADAAKGIRAYNLLDIEEGATIKVNSMGDSIRCDEFVMDVDKDANGNKDLSTGSTVTLRPVAGMATSGDGIDADSSVAVRAGKLDIKVVAPKAKYGIKVRRVNNEEFLKVIKAEKITNIATWKEDNKSSEYYADVVLNEKEYGELVKVANVSNKSADYQGIRTIDGCDDTLKMIGGTVSAEVQLGRNTTVLNTDKSQYSINASTIDVAKTIEVGSVASDGAVRAFLYSSSGITSSTKVHFGAGGKRDPAKYVLGEFNGKAGLANDKMTEA